MNRRQFIQTFAALGSASLWANTHQHSLYQPTRFAFVADEFSYFITVLDIETGAQQAVLNFGIRPQIIEMARDDAMLAVASPEVSALFLYDLHTRETKRLDLPAPVYQIFFIPQSSLMAIALRDRVGWVDYRKHHVHLFPKRFDSPRRDTHLNTYYNLLFSSFSRHFWVLDEERAIIHHKRLHEDESAWQTIDLSNEIKSGFGVGVASPEDELLALTTDDGSEGLVYFPQHHQWLSTGLMHQVGSTNEPMIAPYIDAYSQHILFADVSGHVAHFDLRQSRVPKRFELPFSPRFIRTGWLEKTWLIGGDRGLYLQDFDKEQEHRLYTFPYAITNMWVTGDSKTLLYTIDENAPQLFRLDIRSKEHRPPLRLQHVVMGGKIRMGSNNSICY